MAAVSGRRAGARSGRRPAAPTCRPSARAPRISPRARRDRRDGRAAAPGAGLSGDRGGRAPISWASAQLGDAVLRVRGREPVVDAAARQRVDDEHVRRRRHRFGLLVGDAVRIPWILRRAEASHSGCPQIIAPRRSAWYSRERRSPSARAWPRTARPASRAARRSSRRRCGRRRPPEQHAELQVLREHGDGAADRRGDRHRQRIAVADVGELVRHHARHLLLGERVEQAVEAHTADRDGLRPVAKALGCGLSIT